MLKTLYRPVGKSELDLILNNRWLTIPGRFSERTVFKPTRSFAHAAAIAKQFLTKDAEAGFAGFVTSFQVYTDYLQRYSDDPENLPIELDIPASESYNFNLNIYGSIKVVAAYYGTTGQDFTGLIQGLYPYDY